MVEGSLKALVQNRPASSVVTNIDSDYKAFSYGRVSSRSVGMVCFVKRDGFHLALSYADLRSISSPDPDAGFILEFDEWIVRATGRCLLGCFRYLRDSRLVELVELEVSKGMLLDEKETTVTSLEVKRRRSKGTE